MLSKCARWIAVRWLSFASAVAFAVAVWLSLADKTASATLMASVFLVAALLHVLPRLEYLKAFSVETKFRADLELANELVEQMRGASLALASATSVTAATSNHLTWAGRFHTLMPVIDSLRRFGVSEEAIKKETSIFTETLAVHLLQGMYTVMQIKRTPDREKLAAQLDSIPYEMGSESEEYKNALAALEEFDNDGRIDAVLNRGGVANRFEELARKVIPTHLTVEEVKQADTFRAELSSSFSQFYNDLAARKFVLNFAMATDRSVGMHPMNAVQLIFPHDRTKT